MRNGFFKIHYNIERWEHWHNPTLLAVWVHILNRARWDEKPTRYKGVTIERGQLLIGLHEFADDCGISVQQLRTALNTLKSTNEITSKATNKGTVISVENYAKWQDMTIQSTSKSTSELTNEQQPSNNPVTTRQQLNNKDNNNNKPYNDINALREDAKKRGLNMEMWEQLKNKEWA